MFINKQFILSSSSKSRKKILKNLNLNFKTIKPSCNEAYYKNKMKKINFSPKKISLELSKIKARSISIKKQNKLVIGLDTVISFNGKLLEKAKNMDEAKNKIKKLSGKKHLIISSIAAFYNSKLVWHTTEKAEVKIRKLENVEISKYLKICGTSILGSVGCYQIEKHGPIIIDYISGDFFNVMGFPLFPFLRFLKNFK